MNLTELRNKAKAITDYSPELAVYDEQIDGFINDAYNALWTERKWTFCNKLTYIDIYPDVVPLQPNGLTMGALCTFNSRRIQFSGSVFAFDLPYVWEGQVFEIQGRDYAILKVVSLTEIQLTDPFMGTSSISDLTWKCKHRFYNIPDDAVELLYIGHRDTPIVGTQTGFGKSSGLLSRTEESLNLREDFTAFYSECYINIAPVVIAPGEKLTAERYPTVDATTGDIVAGSKMELCWAFEGHGEKIGPLSTPLIFTQPPQPLVPLPNVVRITFKTFDDITVQSPTFTFAEDQLINQYEGQRKRLFFNQNFNRSTGVRLKGLPVWREITFGSTAVVPGMPGANTNTDPIRVQDEAGIYDLRFLDQMSPGNKRYDEWDGQHPRIRPYPRPIGSDVTYQHSTGGGVPNFNSSKERQFRQWECRYYKKPCKLALQTDTPEMPHEFHQLIVYKLLEDLFNKHENTKQADVYNNKYIKEIKRLEKRYVEHTDVMLIKGQFGLAYNSWAPYALDSLRKTN